MNGIRQLVKKEISSYKPSDIWTSEDHILFLKYCPEKRDKTLIYFTTVSAIDRIIHKLERETRKLSN